MQESGGKNRAQVYQAPSLAPLPATDSVSCPTASENLEIRSCSAAQTSPVEIGIEIEIGIGIGIGIGIIVEGLADCSDFDFDSDTDFDKHGSPS